MASSGSPAEGYAHTDAFDSGFLSVGSIHKVWYAQYGLPEGRPVVFLHGGPGGGTSLANTVFFDPKHYRVILLDQRGAGKSTPTADIRENTSHHLVDDIETLRNHLSIEKWDVFGGSWGSTLALLYAQKHPERTKSLILRGIFAIRKSELANAFAPYGVTNQLLPFAYEEFVNHLKQAISKDESKTGLNLANPDVLWKEYYELLCSDNTDISFAASRAWNKYEVVASTLMPNQAMLDQLENDDLWNLQHARIECHYFMNAGWLEEGALLKPEALERIKDIPCEIVQGRYDIVCPARTAWELHQGLPKSKLHLIADAGHSANEPGTKAKLVEICDQFAKQ